MKGQVISGELDEIIIRQKSDESIELGELLISDGEDRKILLQVYDLCYGSQISQENLEFISGMNLEEGSALNFSDPELRNYIIAKAKPILTIEGDDCSICKSPPDFFSSVREVEEEDISFITKPDNSLYIGDLRSGKNVLDVSSYLPGVKALSHHVLIPATTGRGKSNLTKVMLWDALDNDYSGFLVLDPHDEYYGRNEIGLSDHPVSNEKVDYYTPNNPPPGSETLKINVDDLRPSHFNGVVHWSDAQKQCIYAAHNNFGQNWIQRLLLEDEETISDKLLVQEATVTVVKRRLMALLNMRPDNKGQVECNGVFDTQAGLTTITDICNSLEAGNTVIVDTSALSSQLEILIGSIVGNEVFNNYKSYKKDNLLSSKPVVSIVLEEAPRVIGKDALERGRNIFEVIAREGRKFNVGLTAITQLPSEIPRNVLANMNTKIVLGLEMNSERNAIIESASQDLSDDDRNIASLDKGEAIITSNFTNFAVPIKVPLFEDLVNEYEEDNTSKDYSGVGLE